VIAIVPFQCPQCARQYDLEVNILRLARLKRIALCECEGRFSVSIQIKGTVEPVYDMPSDVDALLAQAQQPSEPPRSEPPRSSEPPPSDRPSRPRRGKRRSMSMMRTQPDGTPPELAPNAAPANPLPALRGPITIPDTPLEELIGDEAPAEAEDRSELDTEPPPSSARRNTLSGQGKGKGKGQGQGRMVTATHLVVEVESVDGSNESTNEGKTSRTFRPRNLITKPGLGEGLRIRPRRS
jgi:hypothetical protein